MFSKKELIKKNHKKIIHRKNKTNLNTPKIIKKKMQLKALQIKKKKCQQIKNKKN